MKVIKAEKAGFCFGVQRAVDIAIETTMQKEKTYSYGQLIHNDQVSQRLANNGLEEVDSIDGIEQADVIVRSHGVGAAFYKNAEAHLLNVIDCTCPFVKKVHRIVDKHYHQGYKIIIIGDEKHPEVIGINGWCNHEALVLQRDSEINLDTKEKYCVVAQTTLKLEDWLAVTHTIANSYDAEFFNTICSATSERQEAAAILAREVDCMIVIGGYHSSNTRKLYEICSELCEKTFHIEKKSDLMVTKIENCGIIGVTAGASTPDWIIDEICDFLNQL